jgi:predicted dehydrogenase
LSEKVPHQIANIAKELPIDMLESDENVRVGVFGAGYWGRKLIQEYIALSKKRSDVKLTRVVDTDKDRLATIAKEFLLPTHMLETATSKALNSIDAAHVATPNDTHYSIVMEALNAGKHVLVEKPMTTNMREAFKLARKAEEKSLILNVGHIFRFNNSVRQTKTLLLEGTVGRPLTVRLSWEDLLDPPPENRDIIFDLCPHPVDVLNYITDEWPTRVRAVGRSFSRQEEGREEVANSLVELNGDAFASINVSWLYRGPKRRLIEITGDRGCLEVDALNQKIKIYGRQGLEEPRFKANNTIEDMITHFIMNITEHNPQENSALVGAMTVGVLTAMRKSMKTEQFVNVLHD